MVKALADRLAEAFAEYLHAQAREDWGYGAGAADGRRTCVAEKYPRHPPGLRLSRRARITARSASCSSCSRPPSQGITLTEQRAMLPAASVSGLYFAHPQAKYFNVGRVGRDQVEDYAGAQGRAGRGGRALARAEPVLRSRRRAGGRVAAASAVGDRRSAVAMFFRPPAAALGFAVRTAERSERRPPIPDRRLDTLRSGHSLPAGVKLRGLRYIAARCQPAAPFATSDIRSWYAHVEAAASLGPGRRLRGCVAGRATLVARAPQAA